MKKILKALSAFVIGLALISCDSFNKIIDIANKESQEQEHSKEEETPAKTVNSISITSFPDKTLYQVGEKFDSTGLVVEATYSDNTSSIVTDYSLSDVDTTSEGNKTVVVYYESCSYTFSISVGGRKSPTGIEVTKLPNKTEYYVGQPFSADGIKVSKKYNDASKEEISNYTIDPVDTSKSGKVNVMVKSTPFATSFEINVITPTISIKELEVAELPEKTEYVVGEIFDPEGLVINVIYDDNEKVTTTAYVIDSVDTSSIGEKTVTITYQSISTSFSIEVIDIVDIAISSSPEKMDYLVGDEFDPTGLVIEAIYNNDKRITLSSDEYSIDPVDMNSDGKKAVTVSYKSFSVSFDIEINKYANYQLVNNADYLLEGDKYVLAFDNAVMGAIRTSSSYTYFEALTSNTTFNSDKSAITVLNKNATILTLASGSNEGRWKLVDENGRKLGVSGSSKKIGWDIGTTDWKISFSGDNAIIASATTGYGRIRYNSNITNSIPGFTNYSTGAGNVKLYQVAKGEEIYPSDFSYSGLSSTTLKVGDSKQLALNYSPSNTNRKFVSYSSSDSEVASISEKGLIKALKAGEVTITINVKKEDETFITKTIDLTIENVAVSSVNFDKTNIEVGLSRTAKITATVLPSNATIKDLIWESSNPEIATVNNGTVNPVSIGKTVITATSVDSGKTATCNVSVVEQQLDEWTILLYLCGSNLESGDQTTSSGADYYGGYATADLTEILSVSNQPDDVNIVIEAGGSKAWASKYNISSDNQTRFHVKNKQLVQDQLLPRANMSAGSTLQNFLEYGLENYPAQKTGLILWNHGGAMHGVCNDEYQSNDALLNSEVNTAVGNALSNSGMEGQKLEWIGYDACLMAIQDIAEFNSEYFNYMVASEESESGKGWDYDTWVDDLYNKKSTETILTAIVDGFIASVGTYSDQTLAWYDLSYASDYLEKWESMSSTLKPLINSFSKSKFQTLMKTVKYYGSDDDVEGYSYFGIFDAIDFLNKIAAQSDFSSASSKILDCKTSFSNLVKYNKKGNKAGNSNGMCLYFPMLDGSGYSCGSKTYYSSSQTNFTNWRSIVTTFGDN